MSNVGRIKKKNSLFDPSNISGCIYWIDASDSARITTSGTTITAITDKSPSARTTTITNTVSYDSANKRIDFTNSTGRFSIAGTGMPISTYDTFFVCRANPSNAGYRALIRSPNNPGLDPFLLDVGTNNVGMWNGSNFVQFGTLTLATSEQALFYTTMSATIGAIQASKNGNTLTTATPGAGVDGSIAVIGNDVLGGQPFGYVHEFIVYNSNLSTSNRELIEGYLAWKWGLQGSLPVGHPYKTIQPFV